MKIGIIYTAFNTENYLEKSLAPWIVARDSKLDGHRFFIGAVSVPFEKFNEIASDKTQEVLQKKFDEGFLDSIWVKDVPYAETTARGEVLKVLRDEHQVDIIWQVDSDEFYTTEEISRIIKFVERQPFVAAFQLSLKNFIFDESHYLSEPFTPMRIHRKKIGPCIADHFHDDNNVTYNNEGTYAKDIQLATMLVPYRVAWVKHFSWLNNERSKKKIEYQVARGWQCSFQWNDETKEVEFNKDFYSKRGAGIPQVLAG